jgi:hypothetical protein
MLKLQNLNIASSRINACMCVSVCASVCVCVCVCDLVVLNVYKSTVVVIKVL